MFPMRFGSYVSDNLGITAGSALSSALGVYAHLVSTVTRWQLTDFLSIGTNTPYKSEQQD
jgi:hypothetical protein